MNAVLSHKQRMTAMLALTVLAFVAAGAALVGYAFSKQGWLLSVFTGAIAMGVVSQVWFIAATLKRVAPRSA